MPSEVPRVVPPAGAAHVGAAAGVRIGRLAASDTGLLSDPGRSLRVACLVWIGLWTFGLLMNHVVGPVISPDRPLDDAWPWPASPVAAGSILLSLALFLWTKRPGCRPDRLLDLALAYEVALALGIGLVNQWTPNSTGLSWICALVLIHPLIVPAPPGKALVAALAAASMDLVGLAVSGWRGVALPEASVIVWTYVPNYLCALLAVLPAHVRFRLEAQREAARELGSYRLGELLGRGGMGEVYRAEHRLLARPAAVKLVRPELMGTDDPDRLRSIVARFEREARVTARLSCPHTVGVYDFGVTDDGTFYYVMELLDGLDLEELVREDGPLPAERAVFVLLQICDSLAEAHAQGLVHRDIKPSNVVVCRYGRRVDFVKVLDFGLALPVAASDGDPRLTTGTAVVGTPAFMAPELVLGGAPVGPATDLYALGCLAYWLLTGELVFAGSTPFEILGHHARTPPEPPSRRVELDVSPALDAAVLSCLAKEPARRPADADELARRLEAAIADRAPWTAERARVWWHLHRPEREAPPGPS